MSSAAGADRRSAADHGEEIDPVAPTIAYPLADALLLEAWEQGSGEDHLGRTLTMLALATPAVERAELSALPLGVLNARLLRLHELSFGPSLEALGLCAACGEEFEFSIEASRLLAHSDRESAAGLAWSEHGRRYQLRPPTTADLRASLEVAEEDEAQELLVKRCLSIVPPPAGEQRWRSSTILERFEQLDAGAELSCALTCPACASDEVIDLDIGRFLWGEVRAAAMRLLADIHTLAISYGWSERAILAMGARRRSAYLELVAA